MVVFQAQRAEAALAQMLAAVDDGAVAAGDLRAALELSRAIASKLATFQARAAAVLAARERHGDSGAGVLRHTTGVSRREAEGRVRTVQALDDLPVVRGALEAGKVSFANASRLAEASAAAGPEAVRADAALLADAEAMSEDQFARAARRWTARNRSDHGEAEYARRHAQRSLRIWNGDGGMTMLRGELDPVTGERIRNRLEAEARRLRRSDNRDERRGFDQAMADALDGITAVGCRGTAGLGRRNTAGATHGGARGDLSAGVRNAAVGGAGNGPTSGAGADAGDGGDSTRSAGADGRDSTRSAGGAGDDSTRGAADDPSSGVPASDGDIRWSRPPADIAVVAHVDHQTGELVSQLATGEPLPPSVLDHLACNASLTGLIYDSAGTPLWRGSTKRTATATQLKALIARDGGCVGCLCHPALCQAHHIQPVSQGGRTTISNMVMLCWNCHHRVHHNEWTVVRRHGSFKLLPPERTRWGPACGPDPPEAMPHAERQLFAMSGVGAASAGG